jgi:hypothetical protein
VTDPEILTALAPRMAAQLRADLPHMSAPTIAASLRCGAERTDNPHLVTLLEAAAGCLEGAPVG